MVLRLSALRTGRLYPQEIHLVLISVRSLSRPAGLFQWKITMHHRESNPQPAGFERSVLTTTPPRAPMMPCKLCKVSVERDFDLGWVTFETGCIWPYLALCFDRWRPTPFIAFCSIDNVILRVTLLIVEFTSSVIFPHKLLIFWSRNFTFKF